MEVNQLEKPDDEQLLEYLKSRLPGVEEFINDLTSKIGYTMIDMLRKTIDLKIPTFMKFLNFKLQLVIDNNILLAEIIGLIKGNKPVEECRLYHMAKSPAVAFYGPPYLQEEITKKINIKIEEDKKLLALEYADKLLSLIQIKEAQWVDDWIKAKRKIGHKDPDDVPYMALCFDLNGHGIISNDKIFINEQKEFKVWTIGEAGKISAEYNNGMICVFFVGNIPNVLKLAIEFVKSVGIAVIKFFETFIKIIVGFLKEGVTFLSKIPIVLWMIFGGFFFSVYLSSENFRDSVHNQAINIKNYLISLVAKIKIWIEKFFTFLLSIWESMKPAMKSIAAFILYLSINIKKIIEQVNEIESQRNLESLPATSSVL